MGWRLPFRHSYKYDLLISLWITRPDVTCWVKFFWWRMREWDKECSVAVGLKSVVSGQ